MKYARVIFGYSPSYPEPYPPIAENTSILFSVVFQNVDWKDTISFRYWYESESSTTIDDFGPFELTHSGRGHDPDFEGFGDSVRHRFYINPPADGLVEGTQDLELHIEILDYEVPDWPFAQEPLLFRNGTSKKVVELQVHDADGEATEGDDSLGSYGERTRLNLLEGDDVYLGGQDGSTVFGFLGNDSIDAVINDSTLKGGEDNDSVSAKGSGNLIAGNNGDDWLSNPRERNDPPSGDNTLRGGHGHDTIYSSGLNNTVFGGTGKDEIHIFGEGTIAKGASWEDTLSAYADDVILRGGPGADTFRIKTFYADVRGQSEKQMPTGVVIADFEPSKDVLYLESIGGVAGLAEAMEQVGNRVIIRWDPKYHYYDDDGGEVILRNTNLEDLSLADFGFG